MPPRKTSGGSDGFGFGNSLGIDLANPELVKFDSFDKSSKGSTDNDNSFDNAFEIAKKDVNTSHDSIGAGSKDDPFS